MALPGTAVARASAADWVAEGATACAGADEEESILRILCAPEIWLFCDSFIMLLWIVFNHLMEPVRLEALGAPSVRLLVRLHLEAPAS